MPNAPALRLPFGARKFVRLSRLNASSRNSNLRRAAERERLRQRRSRAARTSARARCCAPALPNGWLGSVGTLTQSRLNQLVIVCALPCAYGIAGHVGPVVVGAAEVLRDARDDERRARRVGERHRLAGVDAVDAGELPAADERVDDRRRVRRPAAGRGRTAASTRSSSCCCTAGGSPTVPKSASRLRKSCGAGKLPFAFSSDCDAVVLGLRQRQRAEHASRRGSRATRTWSAAPCSATCRR